MKTILALLLTISLTACDNMESDRKQNEQQEKLSLQAVNAVGLPAITKFSEKRTLKSILELRDKEIVTYTYIVDMNNHLKLLCQSVGYGLPYATQFTNPEKPIYSNGVATIPQADPNGLFSPASAEGTWILCLNNETKLATPLYVEPRVIVSPFELK